MAKKTVKLHRRGNPISQNPLMKKGGAHEKSRSAKRQQAKRDLRKQIPFFMGSSLVCLKSSSIRHCLKCMWLALTKISSLILLDKRDIFAL